MNRTLAPLLAFLLLAASLSAAEPSASASGAVRTAARVMARLESAGDLSGGAERFADSMEAALVKLPGIAAVRLLDSGADAREAAQSAAYDLVVEVRITVSKRAAEGAEAVPATLRVERRIIAAADFRVLEEASDEALEPSEIELSQTFWLPLADAVEKCVPAVLEPPAAPKADVGAKLTKASGAWFVESSLYMCQFPDLWAGRTFFFDRLFMKAGLYQFLGGVYLGSSSSSSSLSGFSFVSVPLIQPGFVIGGYFAPSDWALRPYLSLAFFARLSTYRFGFHSLAPLGLTAFLGAERRIAGGVAAFFELGLACYPFCRGFLLAASKPASSGGGYAFLYGSSWYLEYPQFRFGVRVFL